MKKLIISCIILMCATMVKAQVRIELPYSRSIEIKNGKWESWPSNWDSEKQLYGSIPSLAVQHLSGGSYEVKLYDGGDMYTDKVIYDSVETEKIRKQFTNNHLTAYKYADSKNYLWTDNITLKQIAKSPSLWVSTAKAQIYLWEHELGNAILYTAKTIASAPKNYKTSFKATKKYIKGTWAAWSAWQTMPSNTYFQLNMLRENSEYNFKYYEGGSLVKNYNITYDSARTKSVRKETKNATAYKINGSSNEYIYLLNTAMSTIMNNPDKWSQEKDAVILIADINKSGIQTKIK
ncbi:hypothetical protein H4O20_14320 [Aequorivita sp. 609]|uniref:hypothetical protein n=1 Tax=Aequorivita TaxID=153265 RepID=UPI00161C3AF0|nr:MULTISPECIES: hypothetical protein [Aequorivita]MBB6682620.1 hypothetical protein [Aequorivita sp. 609]